MTPGRPQGYLRESLRGVGLVTGLVAAILAIATLIAVVGTLVMS